MKQSVFLLDVAEQERWRIVWVPLVCLGVICLLSQQQKTEAFCV